MEHLNVQFDLDRQALEHRKQRIEQLKENREIQAFLKANGLSEREIEEHSGLYGRFENNLAQCKACKGLPYCTMKIKGRTLALCADDQGFVDLVYEPCRYQSQAAMRIAHKKNFTLSNLEDGDYEIFLQDLRDSIKNAEKSSAAEKRNYLSAYMQTAASINERNGLFLYGPPGVGKTTLLIAAANTYAKQGKRVAFVRVPRLFAELKSNLDDSVFRSQTMARMRNADVLFLDDFGSEMASVWSRDEILFPILDERMNKGRKTYFASNIEAGRLVEAYTLSADRFGNIGAERLAERVFSLAEPVEMLGLSRRNTQAKGRVMK